MTTAPGLYVFTASQLTPLLTHFSDLLRHASLPPRDTETVVVQSQGMRRWVTLQLADALGGVGSLALPFPSAFVRDIEQRLSTGHSTRIDADPFTRELLTWRLDELLRTLPTADTDYQPLQTYLLGADARARFGLATQIAARFDDYQLFRADLLHEWEAGHATPDSSHARWQARLWRALCAEAGDAPGHLAARLRRTIAAVRAGNTRGLPARITVFGVSALPPVFIELLGALSQHLPVRVYTASLQPEVPHPLATSLGLQSREFLSLLKEQGAQWQSLEPASEVHTSLLSTLQHELASGEAGKEPLVLRPGDASLRVHDAHGELRQLEILRDQLLAALAADPELRPHDLLLLVPDATAWAPLVDAVFGNSHDDGARIPYRIADRPARRAQPAADAFARILALEGGRFARSEVFGVLGVAIARQAAALSESDVDTLDALAQRAFVRWGYDASAREALGFPAYEEASWRAGLDRLLMGVATGDLDDEILGLMPESGDTSGDPERLARLAEWIDALAAHLSDWRTPRSLDQWSSALTAAVETLLRAESAGERQSVESLLRTLDRLHSISELASHHAPVPFGVVRDWIEAVLDDDGLGAGFLMGGMTVAALKPMRSLPFRVIAVAGLDDGVFPRRERRAAFDLLEHERRVGDRDLRTDDRQLFLDLLLAARERLILAFNGRAVRDNTPCAPSVVIDELLDHLDRRTSGSARNEVVVQHPLQPFATRYFAGEPHARLFTYSRTSASAARASAARSEQDSLFVNTSIDAEVRESDPLSLHDLVRCWENPSRFFCQQSLRLSLYAADDAASDDEPFALGAMHQGGVKAKVLAASLATATAARDNDRIRRRLRAGGELPLAALGDAWYRKLSSEVDNLLPGIPRIEPERVAFDLQIGSRIVACRLDQIRGDERFVVRAGGVRPPHRIRAWIEHVAMCAARESGVEGLAAFTVVIGKKKNGSPDEVERIPPIAGASDLLCSLIQASDAARHTPLPFFANAGWEYFDAMRPPAKKSRSAKRTPFEAARSAYHMPPGFNGMGGDAQDPYVALCFRGIDPMESRWEEFESLAKLLFSRWPIAEART